MQAGLVGNVVNVPIDVEETLAILPRTYEQSETVQLKFMRKMNYNKSYMYEQVRPAYVRAAIEYLVSQPLFEDNRIQLSSDWFNQHNKQAEDFIVDRQDAEESQELSETDESNQRRNDSSSDEDNELEKNQNQ